MDAYFFDSSGLAKRYIKETGTTWVISLFRPVKSNRIYVVRITLVEVISALMRRVRSNSISQVSADKAINRFSRAFKRKFRHVEITETLAEKAADLVKNHKLRGYDAVQLAAAITANDTRISIGASPLIFVSADKDLNDAAIIEGLTVENPNNYP